MSTRRREMRKRAKNYWKMRRVVNQIKAVPDDPFDMRNYRMSEWNLCCGLAAFGYYLAYKRDVRKTKG